jgi:dTDP-4-dehydrorhamnose reductase
MVRMQQHSEGELFKNKKILLLGSTGALGMELSAQLKLLKYPVINANRVNFDLDGSKKEITNMLVPENIYLVINCAAMTGLDLVCKVVES